MNIDKLIAIHEEKNKELNDTEEKNFSEGKLEYNKKSDSFVLTFKRSELFPKVNVNGYTYFTVKYNRCQFLNANAFNFRTSIKFERS